ncbi:S8 family serine peptidase [Rhodocytophaga rosea]|uniref:S8 family serine peptidase n=1 Tax=Rhodocytophaga rosea TaxID=2704465 RepID=A0A6C0GEC5_9BACT|nr:GEVED domain-containing protein [Rhodocytophaga rosea]QHT66359.1 S8 family serine peptidase [Rhodocytophaga rosea]
MKIRIFTIHLCCLLWLACLTALTQSQPSNTIEEYYYYAQGKKTALTPIRDEIFVTYTTKVNLAKGNNSTFILKNKVGKPAKNDVFAPVNAIRYKIGPSMVKSAQRLTDIAGQFKSDPDVITAYPAFKIGGEKVYVGNKVTYMLKSGAQAMQASNFLKSHQAAIVEEINLGDKILYVVAVSKGKSTFGVANSLFESGLVEYAEPEFTFSGKNDVIPNDPVYSSQWFLNQSNDADIDAPEAWNISTGSANVVVAVIDGHGYDLTHPDLTGKLVNPYDAANDDNVPDPENADANHGTPCVGLIAATTNNTTGVASVGFNIPALPICIGFNAVGNSFETNATIIARAAARVINTPNVVAVSNSYSLGPASFAATVEASYTSMRLNSRGGLGAVILASTGNDNLSNPTPYPASYVNVVGVGASTDTDTRASFSNYGEVTDVVAPGVNTHTLDRTGAPGYALGSYNGFNGTSAACPVAAGVVGLIASVNPNANWAFLMADLQYSCDKTGGYTYSPGYSYGLWNNEMGYGRVNAFKGMQRAMGPPAIASFTPAGGSSGTTITITGIKFWGTTSVTFNNMNVSFTVVNGTTITATIPAGATSGPIRITNFAGSAVSTIPFLASAYCIPANYSRCTTSQDYINNFSLHTLVNNGTGCNGQANNYIFYPATANTTTLLSKGQTYAISMQSGPALHQGFGVWIDFNEDKDFDDTGEFVYKSPIAGTGVFAGAITIPANISSGMKRLRVRAKYDEVFTADQWCTAQRYGETEDYSIAIGYCVPTAACSSGDYINNFSFNTLVNNNSACNGLTNGYTQFAAAGTLTNTVTKGKSYPLKVQSGRNSQGFGVWIDYNNDQDFNDSGELVYASPSAGTGLYTANITIPAIVSTGQRRMRVRSKFNALFTSTQACAYYQYGETEDYTITINNPVVASSQWNKRFGGSGTDNFSVVIKTSDGGYLLGGHSTSAVSGDRSQGSQGAQDFWIVKTDASGNKQWDKRFGGSSGDYLNAAIRTSDGGYMLGGNSLSGISGDKTQGSQGGQDFWVVKISSTGTKQWDKRYGGSGNDDLRTLHQLSTGEYLLAGYSQSGISGDKSQSSQGATDYWVVKINATGGKIWDKRFGGSGDDWLEASVVNSDGSILLAGRSASGLSGDKSQNSQGGRDFWVVKINSGGGKVWDKRFGGTGNEDASGMVATSDGGFLLGGLSTSGISGDKRESSQGGSDFWVIKINSTGGKVWDKRFGGSLTDELRSIITTTDGGFLLGGKSDSGVSGDKTQASQGGQDYWTIKINSSGIKQWEKRFGGSAAEELRTVLQTSDGGYLLAGRSDSGVSGDKTQASQGGTDYWLVKVSSSGGAGLIASARTGVEQMEEYTRKELNLEASPNPFSDKLTIDFSLSHTQQVQLKVYNSQGLEVSTLFEGVAEKDKAYQFEWKATDQMPGLYIIRLGALNEVSYKKVILSK